MGTGSGGHIQRVAALAAVATALLVLPPPHAHAAYAHTVIEGETLSGIAYANGITTESLAAYNGIAADTLVITGTTISIPGAEEVGSTTTATSTTTGSSHTVVEGETLSGIAYANGVTTESLAAYNGIAADTLVITGTTITVPSADEAGTTTTTSTGTTTGSTHTVTEGETLSGIAYANGVTTESLAAYNGIAADTLVITGTTLSIPSSSGTTTSTTSSSAATPASWTTEIYSPKGTAYLASNAASNWEAMRQASVSQYGVDLYPGGSLSAYRTYDQQAYLYDLYLSGQGAPANPPGTSSHEYGTAVDVDTPEMRSVIDEIGPTYGWTKVHGPDEWWHVDYVGP